MPHTKSRGKSNNKEGSRIRSASQKYHTECQEMFTSHDDLKRKKNGQPSDIAPKVHDSTAGMRDKKNNSARHEEGQKKKSSSQQSEHGHSDKHPHRENDEYHDNQSQARPAKNKERTSSAKFERNVQGGQSEMGITCGRCSAHYNNTNYPMLLYCEHTVCADCLEHLKKSGQKCPICSRTINFKDVAVTYPLKEHIQQRIRKKSNGGHHYGSSHDRQSGSSITPPGDTTMNYSPNPPEKASHNGKCIEFSKKPTDHCATCQKWVCDSCREFEHQRRECHLIPKKHALQEMKEAQIIGVKAAVEGIENALVELHSNNAHLNVFFSAMQVASEYIEKEKKRVEMMIEKGNKKKRKIKASLSDLELNINLPDALAALQNIEDLSASSKQWTLGAETNTLDQSISKTTKEIMLCTLQMMMKEAHKNNEGLMFAAIHETAEKTLHSIVTEEEHGLIVPCLTKTEKVPSGITAIPLLNLKASLDSTSALAYLDIGIEGKVLGRVIIRVFSDTMRGRQFLMMCIGEAGSSYRNTPFHRIWWQNRPAEHIWGGDYDKRDGSGGKPVLKLSERERKSLSAGRRMPIKAGLVAGSFENTKTVPSTLFRIYTKDDLKPREDFSSREIEEADEYSAFGMVVDGLANLDFATRNYPVTDIVIISCGIIIELRNRKCKP